MVSDRFNRLNHKPTQWTSVDFYSSVRSTVFEGWEMPIGDRRMRKILGKWHHADATAGSSKEGPRIQRYCGLEVCATAGGGLGWM